MNNIPQDVIDAANEVVARMKRAPEHFDEPNKPLFSTRQLISRCTSYILDQSGELPPPEETLPDGWIAHTGSERPVGLEVMVMVRIADDENFDDRRFCGMWAAEFYRWDKIGITHDITHYKIVSTPESSDLEELTATIKDVSIEQLLTDQKAIIAADRKI